MAIALVASIALAHPTGGTTGPITTTGANLLVVSVAWYVGTSADVAVSDAHSNTWTALTKQATAQSAQRLFYAKNAVVGSGHTVTVTNFAFGSPLSVTTFFAFSGADTTAPFDVENGATANFGTSLATGSVTPAANGSLIVSGWTGMNGTSNPTVDSGLTLTTAQNPIGGTCLAGAAAYLIQSTAAAINPTWSWTGSDTVADAVAVFKSATAGAAVARVRPFVWMPV